MKRQFDTVSRSFDELATTRRRALERPLNSIDDLRRRQLLPIDGELFAPVDDRDTGADDFDDGRLGFHNVRELGA